MTLPARASAHDGRKTAAAINEAELLREALIHQIRNIGALYCVGRRRPISELTPEQQEKVREAYRDTLWSSDYGVDMMGICTTQALAEKFCKQNGPNWFWTKLPVDSVLGDEPVFGEWAHVFPGSDAVEMYENMKSATVAMRVSEIQAMEDERARLEEQIKLAREALTSRP